MWGWERNMDDLSAQQWMNYSNIDQHWIDQGFNKDNLPGLYKGMFWVVGITTIIMVVLYVVMWKTRKNLTFKKLIGEEPLSCFEKYSMGTKFGQEPAINFVSSCLVTNDRIFILIRIIMALWSLTLTIFGWSGNRSIVFGSYFPLATIITIYVSRNRHLIVEGFGSKMQILNKILSFFFALQAPLRIVLGAAWWTGWFGTSRYRDMRKSFNLGRGIRLQQEFLPVVLLLVEILWFDTQMTYASAYHGFFVINIVLIQFLTKAFAEYGKTDTPQIAVWTKENPGAAWIQMVFHMIAIPGAVFIIAAVCQLKIKIFKTLPVIGERLQNRQERSRASFERLLFDLKQTL